MRRVIIDSPVSAGLTLSRYILKLFVCWLYIVSVILEVFVDNLEVSRNTSIVTSIGKEPQFFI